MKARRPLEKCVCGHTPLYHANDGRHEDGYTGCIVQRGCACELYRIATEVSA